MSPIPQFIRRQAITLLRWQRRTVHAARWQLLSPARRQEWVSKRLANDGFGWLFVLGCNNSGTTLLMNVLPRHSHIRSLPVEGQRLTNHLPYPPDHGVARMFTAKEEMFRWTEDHDASFVERIKYDWAAVAPPGYGYILEKSPTDTLRSRWLDKHFSPARFIVLMRHPYAVCEGIRRRKQYSIEDAIRHWVRVHEILDEDLPRLNAVRNVRYEELCADPAGILRSLEEWMEIPRKFSHEIISQNFDVHNMDGTPKPIEDLNQRSFERLSESDVETMNRVAEQQMKRLGYEVIDPSSFAS